MPEAGLSYREALAAVEGRGQGITPGLRRMVALLDLLDHPELTYPTVHLAGTNAKTSTARIIGAILGAHGLTTGVYTSPHLQSLRERFVVWGRAEDGSLAAERIGKDEFRALVTYLMPLVSLAEQPGDPLTYFELTTALAFEWMAQRTVGAGVVETGLGGSWDATNVVAGDVSVLTRVGVDHRAFLGTTPLDNAREKVGILKPGMRCVSADQDPDVAALVEDTARQRGTTLLVMGRDFDLVENDLALGGRQISVRGPSGRLYQDLFLRLMGGFQGTNAALAIAAAEELLGRPLDEGALAEALDRVTSPGRLEAVGREPLTVLDGAHNPQAAQALVMGLAQSFGSMPRTFVVSVFADKDLPQVLLPFLVASQHVIFWTSSSPRAAPAAQLAETAAQLGFPADRFEVAASLPDALARARAVAGDGMVVVTGSLYGAGEARDLILGPAD